MRKSLNLVMASVVERSRHDHPMVLPFGSSIKKHFKAERMVLIENRLYWTLGVLPNYTEVCLVPLPQTIEIDGCVYLAPVIFTIKSAQVPANELIAKYELSNHEN